MANITVTEAQAWTEKSKLDLGSALDSELEASIATQVLATAAQAYDVSSWVDSTTTPKLIRSVISMMYVAWLYERTYSEDNNENYGTRLEARARALLEGIVSGSIDLTDVSTPSTVGSVAFYPNDASSSVTDPSDIHDDPSLGGPKFQMGVVF